MANKLYEEDYIKAIADAIRSKNGTSDRYTVSQMAAAIIAIPVNITPTKTLESITATKTKTTYNVGDVLDISDIVVIANYSDGASADVTKSANIDTSSVNMDTANNFNILVSYVENGITKTTKILIDVVNKQVNKKGYIALTFDDGYANKYGESMMNVLNEQSITFGRAIFTNSTYQGSDSNTTYYSLDQYKEMHDSGVEIMVHAPTPNNGYINGTKNAALTSDWLKTWLNTTAYAIYVNANKDKILSMLTTNICVVPYKTGFESKDLTNDMVVDLATDRDYKSFITDSRYRLFSVPTVYLNIANPIDDTTSYELGKSDYTNSVCYNRVLADDVTEDFIKGLSDKGAFICLHDQFASNPESLNNIIKWCKENNIDIISNTELVDKLKKTIEEDPVVPQTGTWQLKETTGKNYVILGTDDDNQGNPKFFRLLRSYGLPYTMNVEAENATTSRMLGTDVDDTIFINSDAAALFKDNVSVVDFGKYLHDSGLGEVAQHGASGKTLWDSEKLTGDFLTSLHTTYTEAGGTKTEDELKAAIIEALKDTDGSQDASYVIESRNILKEAFGFPIKTVGNWGGAPSVTIDGITLDLNAIKNTKNYDWRKHNYTVVGSNLVKAFMNYADPWNLPRITSDVSSVADIIATIPAGKACEFFWHAPFSDESNIDTWRTLLSHIKGLVDAGKTEVITRSKYYELGEFVDNPITKISIVSTASNIKVGESIDTGKYVVTASYTDGSTSDVSDEAIIDISGVNTDSAGKYTVVANYRGFIASVNVSVIEAQDYTVPEGLKDKDYWFIFKDNTKDMYFAGNTTGTFGEAYMSASILAFTNCTAGNMNGWKSSDGKVWEQTDTDEIHSKTIKTTSGEKIFDFDLAAKDSITWLETSGNFNITYPY